MIQNMLKITVSLDSPPEPRFVNFTECRYYVLILSQNRVVFRDLHHDMQIIYTVIYIHLCSALKCAV